MKPVKSLLIAAVTTIAVSAPPTLADDKLPAGAMTLSAIVTKLEQQGYTRISDASFDDGRWEVEAYKGSEKRELEVDPKTGKVISDRPDKD